MWFFRSVYSSMSSFYCSTTVLSFSIWFNRPCFSLSCPMFVCPSFFNEPLRVYTSWFNMSIYFYFLSFSVIASWWACFSVYSTPLSTNFSFWSFNCLVKSSTMFKSYPRCSFCAKIFISILLSISLLLDTACLCRDSRRCSRSTNELKTFAKSLKTVYRLSVNYSIFFISLSMPTALSLKLRLRSKCAF